MNPLKASTVPLPASGSPAAQWRTLALRVLVLTAAAVLLAAAWNSPYGRAADGAIGGGFAAMAAAAVALALAGVTIGCPWRHSARWMALALAGQAFSLQLIDAGVRIHYQHYRLPSEAAADPVLRWALLMVALQTAAVAYGLFLRRRTIAAWISVPGRVWRLAAGVLLCGGVAAAVSRDPGFFAREVSLAAFLQLVNAGNILLAVWTFPPTTLQTIGRFLDAWLGERGEPARPSLDRFALVAALWVTAASTVLAWQVYERHPHVADEVVYLYTARYFAAGQLVMPPPPAAAAFDVDLMEYTPDKWYGAVPLGWPAVLTLGAVLGIPWLVNPVLAGVNILLTYLLLGELYSRRIVRVSVLLLCFSPWHLFMAMSYMTHTATMTCALLAFLGVARSRRTGRARWAWLAGLAVGAGSVIRPLDGLIVALLIGAWAIGLGGKRLRFASLGALAAGTVLAGALALPYNLALTGDALASPLMRYIDKHYRVNSNAYGFGPDRGLGWPTDAYPGHTPFESLINAQLNGASLNTDLFGWSTGSLGLLAVLLLSGAVRRADYLMLSAMAAVLLAYAPYWGNGGADFGARYWALILLPCAALSARGVEQMEAALASAERGDARASAAVVLLCCLALCAYVPWRSLDKYRHYLRMRPDVLALAKHHRFERSLILVRGERFPDYASAAIYNPLYLQADQPVYAWDRSPAVRAQVLREYADRPVWIVEGPSITGAGFRVAAGPLSATSAGVSP